MDKKIQKDLKKTDVGKKSEKEEIKNILPRQLKKTYREITPDDDRLEKVVAINRTTKVTKGGRKLNFSALIIVGDKKGNVGFGFGKANEVPNAIKKGINDAKKSMIKIALKGSTIPHEITGRYGAAVVLLKPAGEGTGVIAGNVIRAVCDAAGIKDILTKCLKSQTSINVIKATLDGLGRLRHKNELLEK